jgi:hypothetical protein
MPHQRGLMFEGKAKSLPLKGVYFRCSTLGLASCLTYKHEAKLETPVRDKVLAYYKYL